MGGRTHGKLLLQRGPIKVGQSILGVPPNLVEFRCQVIQAAGQVLVCSTQLGKLFLGAGLGGGELVGQALGGGTQLGEASFRNRRVHPALLIRAFLRRQQGRQSLVHMSFRRREGMKLCRQRQQLVAEG